MVSLQSQLLGRLSVEDPLSQGGQDYSELGQHHCAPALMIEQDPVSKTKKKEKKDLNISHKIATILK